MRLRARSRQRWVVLAVASVALAADALPVAALAQARAWVPPVTGPVVRPFVEPIATYAPGHRGVDFAAAAGSAVHASNDGVVSFVGTVAGALHVVVAHDGGIRTSYSFLSSASVGTGDHVERGQVVGRAGGTGEGHGPGLLHFGVRIGDRYVDPMLLFRPRDLTQIVRLVPAPELAAAEHPDPRAERRELERWLANELGGGGIGWVADRAVEAVDAGIELVGNASEQGREWAEAVGDVARSTVRTIGKAVDEVRDRLLATPIGLLVQDLVAGGAAFLGWFARECDDNAPPANGRGGSGNAMVAVGGIDSHRERGDDRSFALPAGLLGYDRSDRYWFSYREGSADYRKEDTYGDLHRKARMLGEQLKRAAREEPGRAFDLIGHSQGGVVIALFLAEVYSGHEHEYPPIDNVVAFASPLKGSPFASSGKSLGRNPVGDQVMRLLEGSGAPIPNPRATSIRQLAEDSDVIDAIADWEIPDEINFTSIAGVEDIAVPVRATELDGAGTQAVDVGGPGDSHTNITKHPRALMAARAALEHRAMPCTSFSENAKGSIASTLLSAAERQGAQLIPTLPS